MNKLLFLFVTGLLFATVCQAQTPDKEKEVLYRDSVYRRVIIAGSDSLNCYLSYPLGGFKVLKEFGDNQKELGKIDRFIHSTLSDTLVYVRQVRIAGYSSIDGTYAFNERLSGQRAEGLRAYLDERYQLSSRYALDIYSKGEDWDGLRTLLVKSDLPYRDRAIKIIDGTKVLDGRERALMSLDGGTPYREMAKTLFPQLRRVEIMVEYDLRKLMEDRYKRKITDSEYAEVLAKEQEEAKAEEVRLREVAQQKIREKVEAEVREKARIEEMKKQEAYIRQEEKRKIEEQKEAIRKEKQAARDTRRIELLKYNPVIGIKTNLVGWAGITPEFERTTFMPNVAVEAFMGDRWSVAASAMFSNFDFDGGKQHWGVSGYSLEPRVWVNGNGCYRGFYFGAFGQAGDFNVRLEDSTKPTGSTNPTDNTANHTGTYMQFGISAGYYLLLTKHFGLEFGARGGYQSAEAKEYAVRGDAFYELGKASDSRMGLMEINVSASYRF